MIIKACLETTCYYTMNSFPRVSSGLGFEALLFQCAETPTIDSTWVSARKTDSVQLVICGSPICVLVYTMGRSLGRNKANGCYKAVCSKTARSLVFNSFEISCFVYHFSRYVFKVKYFPRSVMFKFHVAAKQSLRQHFTAGGISSFSSSLSSLKFPIED